MLPNFIERVRRGESFVSAATNARNYVNIETQLKAIEVELEHNRLLKHQGPRLETLTTIVDSGLLAELTSIKFDYKAVIKEILIRPYFKMTSRFEQLEDAVDRLFISIDPEKYNEVYTRLQQFGFKHGVNNPGTRIMSKDFPRPEKLPAQAE